MYPSVYSLGVCSDFPSRVQLNKDCPQDNPSKHAIELLNVTRLDLLTRECM